MTDADASKNRVLSTLYTTTAMYHAMEIYHSRTFWPSLPLYSANMHASRIILTVDKIYRSLKYPKAEPPPSKVWPIPLMFASIEAEDPIYRDWTLRKMEDYDRAGECNVRYCTFVRKVYEAEELSGQRAHLGRIMKSFGDGYLV